MVYCILVEHVGQITNVYCILVERVGHDRPWASGEPSSCDDCSRHPGCGQEICINDNGHAKSFRGVCDAMRYLHNKVDRIKIALGLGQCKDLYSCKFFVNAHSDGYCKDTEHLYHSFMYSLISLHSSIYLVTLYVTEY